MNTKKAKNPQPSYRAIHLAILAELRLHTELLSTLCQHQHASQAAANSHLSKSILEDEMKRRGLIESSSSSPKSVAFDPFAPTFELLPSATGYTATITLREGSVVYLVNATGPRSNAVKVSDAGLLPVLVAPISEIQP